MSIKSDIEQSESWRITKGVDAYWCYLGGQSPVYSDSHRVLRALYREFGNEAVDRALDVKRAQERGE